MNLTSMSQSLKASEARFQKSTVPKASGFIAIHDKLTLDSYFVLQ